MIEKGICDKVFNWSPSSCECECDKSCDVGEGLDYTNCKYRKSLANKLVPECNENIDEKKLHANKMIYNSTLNDYKKIFSPCEPSSCTANIVFFVIFFIISMIAVFLFIFIGT